MVINTMNRKRNMKKIEEPYNEVHAGRHDEGLGEVYKVTGEEYEQ